MPVQNLALRVCIAIDAMMDVLDRHAVAANVVPYGKHAADNLVAVVREGVFFLAHDVRSPVLVEIFGVEVVVVITCVGHDIGEAVRDADTLVAEIYHGVWRSVSV